MRNRLRHILAAACILAGPLPTQLSAGQEVPGAVQKAPIAITNATVHTVSNGTLQNATVLFDAGKIVAVGTQVAVPQNATRIDGTGKHVYPGFIAAATSLGLNEIGAVRATRDASEVGPVNPNVRAEVAYDPDSDIIPTVRSNGVLIANVAPEGGLVSGMSSLMRLDGWTREDIAVQPRSGMLLSWPNMRVWHAWWQRKSDDDQQAEIKDNLDRIDALFREGRAYALAADAGLDTLRRDLRLEAMRSLFDGSVPLIVRADRREQIDAAMDLAKQFGLRLIIEGGYDAAEVADRLRTMNVPVILRPVNSLPAHDEDAYDASFTLPLRLEQAGVTYCISDPGFWQVRSLPFHAGTAVAYGLPEEKAIAAITLTPARIFGVDANYGALEPGKSATLFISNGNALDVRGNVVTYAWIDGRSVDLSNRHTRLSEKYRERYSR